MNYPISATPQKVDVPRSEFVSEELVVAAIVGVVTAARARGQSLDDLTAEVLADDALLEPKQRRWLSEIVTAAWEKLP